MSKRHKVDPRLDKLVDSRKLDLRDTKAWLRNSKLIDHELVLDLIIDHLRSERYPDPRTLQCELIDLGIANPTNLRRLIRRLWGHLAEIQDSSHTSKYQRTSTACNSRVSSSVYSHSSYSQSYTYSHNSSFYHFDYSTNHS